MAELVLKIDDGVASRLSKIAHENYDGDQNAVISDALSLLFLQPIRKERRQLARLIDEIRGQVEAAGGITEKDIDRLIVEYRQNKYPNSSKKQKSNS
ncbi:hypothetical protein L0337_01555 [candidate division KSB1 bacterium]|nr:hypothetical protein [candidate division KSB1 bacterium]